MVELEYRFHRLHLWCEKAPIPPVIYYSGLLNPFKLRLALYQFVFFYYYIGILY